ncbi:MaoC family dehydratase [Pseudonocardia aurantiaca]|uniref:MaoC/PaaZ C-terminal domain-containing protein n=1 Tax=Pseudonocardia aurantiaca TaxID=75290 RepID=A0ABW4FMW9_9PSEU
MTAVVGGTVRPSFGDVEVGTPLPEHVQVVVRQDLVRYAAASGDLNTIHWDEATARAAGLPDVIAHGMYTMGVAGAALTAWAGAGAVRGYRTRFARPVVVPRGDEGATIVVTGRVAAKLDAPAVRVDLEVRCGADKVLTRTSAIVELGP